MEVPKYPRFSAPEMKELAIEWALRTGEDQLVIYDLPKSSLENMTMLDTDNLDMNMLDSAFLTGSSSTLDFKHEEREEKRLIFLRSLMKQCFSRDITLKMETMKLLDEEIESLGLSDSLHNSAFKEKAFAVAKARLSAKHFGTKNLTLKSIKRFDYQVALGVLRGGHGGHYEILDLYFDFKNKFWFFLEILQETTQFSMIPPINLEEQQDDGEEVDFSSSTTSQDSVPSSISSSGSLTSTRTMSESTLRSRSSLNSTPQPDQDTGAVKRRGYTLEHGPWLYRISEQGRSARAKRGAWHNITSLASYNKMIIQFQEHSHSHEGKPPIVSIIHYLDKVAVAQWSRIRANEERAEREFLKLIKESGFDDEDIGEPFMKGGRLFTKE
ncbi:uncharacterized protein LY89DRAFT_489373 [Mollisia scopiformis]|uniref:Uncharacterized protein n=1 Tax=Mollisia scopiformis TaxID=149040 RepID=A0A194XGP8_MOLSC|nr:uncharacterized protein LY89DRAFT_489373 [Mollisia scopiformis]KUJ19375.1 hypothetical protein LY89DRAFT_489373 [Mollisia scopiformis]